MRKILIQSLICGIVVFGTPIAAQAGGACPCEDCVLASGTSATRDDAMADARAASAAPDLCDGSCAAKAPLSMELVPVSAEDQKTQWSVQGRCEVDDAGDNRGTMIPMPIQPGNKPGGVAYSPNKQ